MVQVVFLSLFIRLQRVALVWNRPVVFIVFIIPVLTLGVSTFVFTSYGVRVSGVLTIGPVPAIVVFVACCVSIVVLIVFVFVFWAIFSVTFSVFTSCCVTVPSILVTC